MRNVLVFFLIYLRSAGVFILESLFAPGENN